MKSKAIKICCCCFFGIVLISKGTCQEVFLNLSAGVQMSGIKNEDFVLNNYSPKIDVSAMKLITQVFGLQIGYQGYYFNTIMNADKRRYTYISGSLVTRVMQRSKKFDFSLLTGSGLFMNHYYKRPSVCADVGVFSNFVLANQHLNSKISAIFGWDIYQGNADILPSLTIGYTIPIKFVK
jgi:hypothetical protein